MTTVLIVDDLSSIREFLKINLSSEPDIKVVGLADNGQGAIAQTEEHQPDIILMDINMPGEIDGIQATEKIMSRFPQSKILLLTSQDDRQQLERSLKAGSRGYILKNTSIKDLASIIRLTEKGFFQIGPILGNWDGTLHNLTQMSAGQLEKGRGVGGENAIIPHDFNYSLEANQTSQINHTLSNFSSELLQLQKTIKSQENTIVNLTNQYSQVEPEINYKLRKEQLGSPKGLQTLKGTPSDKDTASRDATLGANPLGRAYPWRSPSKNLGLTFYGYGSKFNKSHTQNQQHLLFISSFFLGAITVLLLVLLVMVIG